MTQFSELGYEIVENAIEKQTAELLSHSMQMARDVFYFENRLPPEEIGYQNDTLVDKCWYVYSLYPFESLLKMMLPIVERVTGKTLYPTYSYARIYYQDAVMPPHIDRPSCEYSATVTIDIDEEPWDIWIKDLKGVERPIKLDVGSMCVYMGTKCLHWRDKYSGKRQIQAFLHYVDANGKYYNQMYDGRVMLGAVKNDLPYREITLE